MNGYRKPGELYLVGELPKFQCCKLPITLPGGILPKNGIVPLTPMAEHIPDHCINPTPICPAFLDEGKNFVGLMWINESHYPSAAFFFSEAREQGIQLQIKRLQCNITPGKSWILLAHRKAVVDYSAGAFGWIDSGTGEAETSIKYHPGIFTMFRIDSIEYVITEENHRDTDQLQDFYKAGIVLVNVIQDSDLESGIYPDEKEVAYE